MIVTIQEKFLKNEKPLKTPQYKFQLICFIVWIFVVILLFKFISERQVAAAIAGSGFIILPTFCLMQELRTRRNRVYLGTLIIFLVFSALPIFLLRIFNWGVDFNTLSLFGVEAQTMHKYSNYLYMLMVLACGYQFYLVKRSYK
jgi:hypothetical protein